MLQAIISGLLHPIKPVRRFSPHDPNFVRNRLKSLGSFALVFILLTGLVGFINNLSDTLTVGLQLIPHPTGVLSCSWSDPTGKSHNLGSQSTEKGTIVFRVPSYAQSFQFIFAPASQPYYVKSLNLYHLPLFTAQWLNNMLTPAQPVYTQQYMGPNDTLEITATRETPLSYPRFFSMLLKLLHLIQTYTRPLFAITNALALTIFLFLIVRTRRVLKNNDWGTKTNKLFHCCEKSPVALACALISCVLFCLPVPVQPITSGCDSSWNWVLNHLALTSTGIGTRAFFTYGPFGFTLLPLPMGANVWFSLFCNAYYAFLFLLVLFTIFRFFEEAHLGLWGIVLCTYLLPATEWRWGLLVLLLLTTCCHLKTAHRTTVITLAICAGPAIVYASLLKFSLAIIIACSALTALFYLVLFNRGLLFTVFAPLSASVLIGVYLTRLFLFPSFSAIAKWVSISWEIASGYNMAMVTQVSWLELAIPCLLVAGFMGAIFPFKRLSPHQIGLLMLVSPLIFFAFKYSVTRAGFGNIRSVAYVFPCILATLLTFTDHSWRNRILHLFGSYLAAGVFLSVFIGYFFGTPMMGGSLKNLVNTIFLRNSIQNAKVESVSTLKDVGLPPKWAALIGTNTFISYPMEMTYAPANALNFIPFPIIQGYSAYSQKLDQLGAQLFCGSNAPEWALCSFSPLDQRNVIIDTPAVWNAIRANYSPAAHSEESLLLKRGNTTKTQALHYIHTYQLKPGTWFDLSTNATNITHLAVEWSPTLFGKFSSLLFRNTRCSITIERNDGKTRRWRFIPDTASTPFSVNIPFDNADFIHSWDATMANSLRIRRIQFDCEQPFYYHRKINITFVESR